MDQELITYLDRRFDEINSRFERVDSRLEGMDSRFDGMDSRFDGVDSRFDGVDSRLEGMDSRFERQDSRTDGLEGQLRETGVLLEGLAARIETVAEGVLSNGEAHRRLRAELDRQFEELKAMNRVSHVGLEGRMSDHDRRLESLEGRVDVLEAD